MASEISIRFDPDSEFQLVLRDAEIAEQSDAWQWLDEQFVAFDAEPLRASGKVLSADKVLAVAKAAGPERFRDSEWAHRFAANALGALARNPVRVEVDSMTVTY